MPRAGAELVARIARLNLRQVQLGNLARAARGARQVGVVGNDHLAVAALVHIGLNHIRALGQSALEGGQGVLRQLAAGPPVPENDGVRQIEEGVHGPYFTLRIEVALAKRRLRGLTAGPDL